MEGSPKTYLATFRGVSLMLHVLHLGCSRILALQTRRSLRLSVLHNDTQVDGRVKVCPPGHITHSLNSKIFPNPLCHLGMVSKAFQLQNLHSALVINYFVDPLANPQTDFSALLGHKSQS